jgi:hypothetical protein
MIFYKKENFVFLCSMKQLFCFGIIAIVFFCACKKIVKYSDIPEIKFISIENYNDTINIYGQEPIINYGAILAFYFQDGEGDLGLDEQDLKNPPFNAMPYRNNLFIDIYEKQHGNFVKSDTVFDAKFPRLSNIPGESINGEIYHTITNCFDLYDTIQLQFYIVDRKLNKSNIETANIIKR